MTKRWTLLEINGEAFELDTKETVEDPVVFYKSVYDVYGIELIYQFTEDSEDNTLAKYSGRIKWKITSRNQNDDKN